MAGFYQYTEEQRCELSENRKSNTNKNVDRRLRALEMRANGKTAKEIQAATDYHANYILQLEKKYTENGIEAIVGNHYHGNRRNMSVEQEEEILQPFLKAAEAGQLVDVSEIKAAYQEKVGHTIGSGQIYYVLKRHKMRRVKPRSQHPKKASEEAIDASKKLKQNAKNSC